MIKLNLFEFERYLVVKLKDIESQLTASDYKSFLAFLTGQTMMIDDDRNTLIFYSDIAKFLVKFKKASTFNRI